jgi:N-dimethylarginine dimethylaminohydrolase
MKTYGCQSMVGPIKGVLIKSPREAFVDQATIDAQWRTLFYFDRPDYEKALAEYEGFVSLLSRFGMEICYLPASDGVTLDSIYTHDAAVVSNAGVVLSNMGKAARRREPRAMRKFFEGLGIPVLGEISGEGLLEGGDVLWLDERTVAVGEGYRTNAEGIRQLRALLGEAVEEVIAVPLPHWTGPDDCLHLLSNISPLDDDLAVVYSRLLPVPFRQWLIARGLTLIEVPDSEYDSMACNVLAVAPRKCIMLDGNPLTKAQLEAHGCEVWTYKGEEISRKGAGGPTCLTRPFWRA